MKRMKKALSFLLVCCMLLGMLPSGGLAAEIDPQQEEAQQFALYMSELGLVDDSGQLIQDNTFTVEDGTRLSSLDELLDWLGECEEADMGTLVTVDATGRTATADLILQAISVESQVGLLATTLNALAEGDGTSDTTTTTVDTSAHDLYLVQTITSDDSNRDILIIRVGVSTSEIGSFVAAPNDIKIQSGLFVNRMVLTSNNVEADGAQSIYLNGFNSTDTAVTLETGNTYIEYKLNLSKLRYYFNGQYASDWSTNGILGNNGHWQGYEIALFQSRIISGAPEQSAQSYFKFAPFSGTSEILENATGKYKVAATNSSKPVVISIGNSTTTIDGKSCFTFTPSTFNLTNGSESYSVTDKFQDAWSLGAGDADKSIIIEDAYALLKVDNSQSDSTYLYGITTAVFGGETTFTPFNFDLYRNTSGTLTKIANGTSLYQYGGSILQLTDSMAKKLPPLSTAAILTMTATPLWRQPTMP